MKKENDLYGGWIKADGKIIDVYDACQHVMIKDYGEAEDEGWIAFTYSNGCYAMGRGNFGMSFRFNPIHVTRPAISCMRLLVQRSKQDKVFISDVFMRDFKGYSQGMEREAFLSLLPQFTKDRMLFTNSDIKLDIAMGKYESAGIKGET